MCKSCLKKKYFYCDDPELAETVQKFFHCQIRCNFRNAKEAFMDTVEIYRELRPSTPAWIAPRLVAEILTPNLVL